MWHSLRVGWFLALRQLRRSNPWTTLLTVFIMTLTLINLVAVSGILVGLIEGSSRAYRQQYSGDVLIQNLEANAHIERARNITEAAESLPGFRSLSGRYIEGATLEANYSDGRRLDEGADKASVQLTGIDPEAEQDVTGLFDKLIAGRALQPGDSGNMVIGKGFLEEYTRGIPGFDTLENVRPGSRVFLTLGDIQREYTVVGIVSSKIEAVDFRAFIPEAELRGLTGRTNYDMDEIAIDLDPGYAAEEARDRLKDLGFDRHARIETWEQSQGSFFRDIKTTFNLLGSVIGAIGLMVASITIFIVIFINAVTRQRYIGILKSIGVEGRAITISYVFLSIFYGIVGGLIGVAIVYLALEPYIAANPIDFPFSDGILAAPVNETALRFGLLMLATALAGYIPAMMITRRPALKSLLGR